MNIRKLLVSWDFIVAAMVGVLTYGVAPHWIVNGFAKDVYAVGISVLSIIFSVFFAALAIIMAASDDEFLQFLNERGDYSALISTFRFTLGTLFLALIWSLGVFAYTSFREATSINFQNKWFLVVFGFLFLYALLAAAGSAMDAISYSKFRSEFLSLRKKTSTK